MQLPVTSHVSALVASQLTHAAPAVPQLDSALGVQVSPLQQPPSHEAALQPLQTPPSQVCAPQLWQVAPAAPQALLSIPELQTFPWQQPVHELVVQAQPAPVHSRPALQ